MTPGSSCASGCAPALPAPTDSDQVSGARGAAAFVPQGPKPMASELARVQNPSQQAFRTSWRGCTLSALASCYPKARLQAPRRSWRLPRGKRNSEAEEVKLCGTLQSGGHAVGAGVCRLAQVRPPWRRGDATSLHFPPVTTIPDDSGEAAGLLPNVLSW